MSVQIASGHGVLYSMSVQIASGHGVLYTMSVQPVLMLLGALYVHMQYVCTASPNAIGSAICTHAVCLYSQS